MNVIAARTIDTASGPARRGQVVDVSAWPVSALVAALRNGDVAYRVGSRVLVPRLAALHCDVCGLPFEGDYSLAAHARAAHGHHGGGGVDPEPAWVEVTIDLGHEAHAAVLKGGPCPVCGLPASAAHMARRHPEARAPGGAPYVARGRERVAA